jgi:hypothetical protein
MTQNREQLADILPGPGLCARTASDVMKGVELNGPCEPREQSFGWHVCLLDPDLRVGHVTEDVSERNIVTVLNCPRWALPSDSMANFLSDRNFGCLFP